jgi:deazaflavin-dependent oxidoreductase (nitroreductase family)
VTIQDPANWIENHLHTYRTTDGAEGHVVDLTGWGGRKETTTLLLRTFGRKSGKPFINPLIYLKVGEEYVIVASKGGAPEHPGWFLNLSEAPDVIFQVARDHFRGTWRIIEGDERASVWNDLVNYFAPYGSYQAATSRLIPIVALKPVENIPSLD